MAINSCTINTYTINSLKCRKKSIIPLVGEIGNQVYHTRINPLRWKHDEDEDYIIPDGPQLKLTVEIKKQLFSEIYDVSSNFIHPIIYISNFDINQNKPIRVSVTDLTINNKYKL